MFSLRTAALGLGLALAATTAQADSWTLDGSASKLAFGSIKFNDTGEVHSFSSIDGAVAEDGSVTLGIDLSSVETNIDIRDERMVEHVFKNAPRAAVSAQIDMAAMEAVPVGDSAVMEVEGTLDLLGVEVPMYGDMFVMRLAQDKVMVTTDSMMFLSTADAEIDPGVDKLMELASLPNIVRAVPVTLRLMFDADGSSG
ncbi:YceI family protein [uncultured Tateyamaria sp.]|uniref:YceI family protein n=1 Tax=uncultured Tateyamaria sp. TaxID=455651 RepID=UPI00262AAA2D|nr:YceI family protein [uncultured Tateyamaria sp.]